VPVVDGSPFPVANLPYGVAQVAAGRHVVVAIGDRALDLTAAADLGLIDDPDRHLAGPDLNPLLAAGRPRWSALRARVGELLTDRQFAAQVTPLLLDRHDLPLVLPFEVADYVDFYSSEQHATNVGRIFRPTQPPLPQNWKHLPVGYHGRSGTVVVSGTPVVRPHGQRRTESGPAFGPSARLDIEAEVGFVVGTPTGLGRPVSTASFGEHVFGVVLLNDWSARDIQSWETVPLGPFLGKSFATSISPWVVPLEALEAARLPGPRQDPAPLEYLRPSEPWGLDLTLEVSINGQVVSRPPYAGIYWTADQQLAHLTVNGAALRTGDLFASGTVSGDAPDQLGSLIELTWNGTRPLKLADGSTRTYLQDGDTVSISAFAPAVGGGGLGFGAVAGTVAPAIPPPAY
jgi:fumarylacetoacetase